MENFGPQKEIESFVLLTETFFRQKFDFEKLFGYLYTSCFIRSLYILGVS